MGRHGYGGDSSFLSDADLTLHRFFFMVIVFEFFLHALPYRVIICTFGTFFHRSMLC